MKIYQITNDVNPDTVEKYLPDGSEFFVVPCHSEEEIIEKCRDANVLIPIYEKVSKKVIDSLKDLEYICVASIGYNSVDVDYAKKKGILVSHNPLYCIHEVADHTLALSLTLLRKINAFNQDVKINQRWDYNTFGNSLRRLGSLWIGLIGFGNIAQQVAQRFLAFGSKVMAYDPFLNEDIFLKFGVKKVELEEIQNTADLVSLHLPLNDATRHIIDKDFLNGFKKKPYLINCSRGELIDQQVLRQGLEDGCISGLGLDVLNSETPNLKDLELIGYDNVLLTPHVAFYSQESIIEADSNVGQYIYAYANNDLEKIPII